EMREGETLILSGLLDRRILRDLSKLPFLGDLPIIGALFRATRFRNQETELIFVVTPRIVKALPPGVRPPIPSIRKYDDPDMRQVPSSTPPPAAVVPQSSPAPYQAPQPHSSLHESTLSESTPANSPSTSLGVPEPTTSLPSPQPSSPTDH